MVVFAVPVKAIVEEVPEQMGFVPLTEIFAIGLDLTVSIMLSLTEGQVPSPLANIVMVADPPLMIDAGRKYVTSKSPLGLFGDQRWARGLADQDTSLVLVAPPIEPVSWIDGVPAHTVWSGPAFTYAKVPTVTTRAGLVTVPQGWATVTVIFLLPVVWTPAVTVTEGVPCPEVIVHPDGKFQV
jgi:hypothetical protein